MKINRKHIILALAGVALFFAGYQRGYEKPASRIGIVRVEFVVVDAVTGEVLEFFDYSSPSLRKDHPYQGAITMLNGSAFNSFFAISDAPLTFSVGKDGYETEMVEAPMNTRMRAYAGGNLGSDIVTVKLRRRAEPGKLQAVSPAPDTPARTEP